MAGLLLCKQSGFPVIEKYLKLSHYSSIFVWRTRYAISIPNTSIILDMVAIDGFALPRSISLIVARLIPDISERSCCDKSSDFRRVRKVSCKFISLLFYTFGSEVRTLNYKCKKSLIKCTLLRLIHPVNLPGSLLVRFSNTDYICIGNRQVGSPSSHEERIDDTRQSYFYRFIHSAVADGLCGLEELGAIQVWR